MALWMTNSMVTALWTESKKTTKFRQDIARFPKFLQGIWSMGQGIWCDAVGFNRDRPGNGNMAACGGRTRGRRWRHGGLPSKRSREGEWYRLLGSPSLEAELGDDGGISGVHLVGVLWVVRTAHAGDRVPAWNTSAISASSSRMSSTLLTAAATFLLSSSSPASPPLFRSP